MSPDLYHDLTSAIDTLEREMSRAMSDKKYLLALELGNKVKELRIIYRELYELYMRERGVQNLENKRCCK